MHTTTLHDIDRPSLRLLGCEPWRAALEFVSHKPAPKPALSVGNGHPVVGFSSLAPDGTAVGATAATAGRKPM